MILFYSRDIGGLTLYYNLLHTLILPEKNEGVGLKLPGQEGNPPQR